MKMSLHPMLLSFRSSIASGPRVNYCFIRLELYTSEPHMLLSVCCASHVCAAAHAFCLYICRLVAPKKDALDMCVI